MLRKSMVLVFLSILLGRCASENKDHLESKAAYGSLKQSFADGQYEKVIKKGGIFVARHPYSEFVADSELLIADSHFSLSEFIEAAAAYAQFTKLYNKHPKRAYAFFKIGECHWKDSSEQPSRDQEETHAAIKAWKSLTKEYPNHPLTAEAKDKMTKGYERIALSYHFVADYYCKMEKWHSCAFRMENLILSNFKYPLKLKKKAYQKAAYALEKMLEADEKEENIYTKRYSKKEIKNKAKELKQVADTI